MAHHWITKLQSLLDANISSNDILIVRLTKIYRKKAADGLKYLSSEQICSAQIENKDDCITWHISDILDETLIIDTPIPEMYLGHTDFDFASDEASDDNFKYMYIITACRIIRCQMPNNKLNIRCSDADAASGTIHANNIDEAKAIMYALRKNGTSTKFL